MCILLCSKVINDFRVNVTPSMKHTLCGHNHLQEVQPALECAAAPQILCYLCVLSPPLSVFHLLQVSVCLIYMPSLDSSCVCWIVAIKKESTCVHTHTHTKTRTHTCIHMHMHTHTSLTCGASCPDCVNPLCPPHISVHPSTSTLL